MTLGRRTFVMTDPQAAEKAFQARRAGLAPADPAADEAYVKLLRILSPARPREQWFMRTVRELSDAEAAAYIAGRPLGAEVVRLDVWSGRVEAKATIDRAHSVRRAERAEQEAARMRREARRFDDP